MHVLAQSVMSDAAAHKLSFLLQPPSTSLVKRCKELDMSPYLFFFQVEFLFLWVGIAKLSPAFAILLWVQNSSTEHCFMYAETMILMPFW